jgi:5-carboxymethyl-2-hydroxymuconate isomerase
MIHVDLAILPGRDDALKTRLGELTLELLCGHLEPDSAVNIQVTVEIRDLAGYHKRVVG